MKWVKSYSKPAGLFERWITLSSGQIPIQWIACFVLLTLIPWIAIYPIDSVIHLSNNWSQDHREKKGGIDRTSPNFIPRDFPEVKRISPPPPPPPLCLRLLFSVSFSFFLNLNNFFFFFFYSYQRQKQPLTKWYKERARVGPIPHTTDASPDNVQLNRAISKSQGH